MITILKTTAGGLKQVESICDDCWVRLVDPTPEELTQVSQSLGIPEDMLHPALDLDESPRTEKDNGVLLIVLRVPFFEGETESVPYTTIPLGILLTDRATVTVSKMDTGTVDELAKGKVGTLDTARRNSLFVHIFLMAAKRYLTHLHEIDKAVEEIEDRLEMSTRNKEVMELLKYQKSMTYFTTALKADEMMMKHLHKSHNSHMAPEDQELFEDALTEFAQAIEMTNISSGILTQMMDAFASIISNNLNVVIKFLTSVTIILALPTMVASIYGMNILLPFQQHPQAFWITLGSSVVLSLLVVILFRYKRWL